MNGAISKQFPMTCNPALREMLLDHLRTTKANFWHGIDGLTLDGRSQLLLRGQAAAGQFPTKRNCSANIPSLAAELETFFAAPQLFSAKAPGDRSSGLSTAANSVMVSIENGLTGGLRWPDQSGPSQGDSPSRPDIFDESAGRISPRDRERWGPEPGTTCWPAIRNWPVSCGNSPPIMIGWVVWLALCGEPTGRGAVPRSRREDSLLRRL